MIPTAKRHLVGAVASGLLVLGVVAVAQPQKAEPAKTIEKPSDPKRTPVEKMMDELPELKVKADDTAEVKATKERMLAVKKKCLLTYVRTIAGQFAEHSRLGDSLRDLTDVAQELYSDPKDQLPWFEFRLAVTKEAPDFPSVVGGGRLDESETLYWEGEREKAEAALLKLKKKLEK